MPPVHARACRGNAPLPTLTPRRGPISVSWTLGVSWGEPDVASNGFHVHGTAHHEALGWNGIVPCGHAVTGFNQTRDEVSYGFAAQGHDVIKYARWDNTRSMMQCDGSWVNSDGWAAYIRIP